MVARALRTMADSIISPRIGALPTLEDWQENDLATNLTLLAISLFLICFAGLMSGLTLGLMSLDVVDVEVLKRSGTAKEKKYATKIMPVIKDAHFLLVTLLLGNAGAMESLPLVLDRLANPVAAILLSVTAVLLFGEIIPQAACARHGLAIGAHLAVPVRLLMILFSPVAWPIGKLLDFVLGAHHPVLFRRKQLKALVDLHGEEGGLGGKLTVDETKIIAGALDLTNKIAYRSMTPLEIMFMLSTDDRLDEATLRKVLQSGHSRIPVYSGGNRSNIVGLILVKELIQYKMSAAVPVSMIRLRSLPRLVATTPMYDMLKLFQTGRSHMAVLTQPPVGWQAALAKLTAPQTSRAGSVVSEVAQHSAAEDAVNTLVQQVAAEQAIQPGSAACGASHSSGSGSGKGCSKSSGMAANGSGGAANSSASSSNGASPSAKHQSNGNVASGADCDGTQVTQGAQAASSGMLPRDGSPRSGLSHTGTKGELKRTLDEPIHQLFEGCHTDEKPGEPIGIITIEDVIEELISSEIVDETDQFVDNERRIKVDVPMLVNSLPERLRLILSAKAAAAGVTTPGGPGRQPGGGRGATSRGGNAGRADLTRPLLPR